MVVICEIVFDENPHGTYFAGQTVSGCVVINTNKAKIIKGVAIKIQGRAQTKWTDKSGPGDKKSVQYYGSEDYIASTTYLIGSEQSQTVQIETGTHRFNFACSIPPQCPSSFEGVMGHIRYVVKVVFYRPWKFDQTFTRAFTVLKLMDLNYESPVIRVPASQETFKTFCFGPCTSNPLKINMSVPQTGYVPGQSIFVTVMITNESNVPVTDVKLSLVMFAVLFSNQPRTHSRTERMCLFKIKGGVVHKRSSRQIQQTIPIPATPPSCYNLCRIIQISYHVEVEAKLKGMHESPILSIPIVIGNVPLLSVVQQQPMPKFQMRECLQEASAPQLDDTDLGSDEVFTLSNGSILPVIDPVRNPSDPLSSAELNIELPTYQEAMYMTRANCNEEDQHPLGESEFLPRYPVYNIPTAPSDPVPVNHDPNKSTWL